jgi:hypothetical protein
VQSHAGDETQSTATHTGQPENVIRQQVTPSSTLPARPSGIIGGCNTKNQKSITFNPINEMIGDIWLLIFPPRKKTKSKTKH